MSLSTLSAELQAIKAEMDAMDFTNNLEYIINFDGFNVSSPEDVSHLPKEWIEFIEEDEDEFYVCLVARVISDQCLTDMPHSEVLALIGADKFPELVIDCVEL